MPLEDIFKQSDLLHLASGITSRLLPNSAWMKVDQQTWTAHCGGLLDLSHDDIRTATKARCIFGIRHDWVNTMPVVCCLEPWVKKGITDWHVYTNGGLCFELALRWKNEVDRAVQEHGIMYGAAFAATWCLNNTRWLLYRHRYAYENNINEWPKEWPCWRHGKDGERDYRWMTSKTAKEKHES